MKEIAMSLEDDRRVDAERHLRLVAGEIAGVGRGLGDRASPYLHAILENIGAGVLLIEGADRRIVMVNQFMCRMLGLSSAQVVSLTRDAIVEHVSSMAEDPDATREALGRLPPDGAPYFAREQFVLSRPKRRVIHWEAIPVLLPSGVGQLCLYRDVTAEAAAKAELERLASTDPLTGLANRRRGLEVLEREMARSDRYGNELCVAMFDLDNFKRVNDTLGHAVGDEVLGVVSTILSKSSRSIDVPIRWGGEEMLLLLPDCGKDGALAFANRFRAEVERWRGDLRTTVSGGVARYRAGETVGALLKRADERLYAAKQAGRNRIVG